MWKRCVKFEIVLSGEMFVTDGPYSHGSHVPDNTAKVGWSIASLMTNYCVPGFKSSTAYRSVTEKPIYCKSAGVWAVFQVKSIYFRTY